MTKSEIFKAAHKLAKAVVDYVGDYRIALSFSLKTVIAKAKKGADSKWFDESAERVRVKFEIKMHGFAFVGKGATNSGKSTSVYKFESVSKYNEIKDCSFGAYYFENGEVFANKY